MVVGLVLCVLPLSVCSECKWGCALSDILSVYTQALSLTITLSLSLSLIPSISRSWGYTHHPAPLFKSWKQGALSSQLSHTHCQNGGFITLHACRLLVRDSRLRSCRSWMVFWHNAWQGGWLVHKTGFPLYNNWLWKMSYYCLTHHVFIIDSQRAQHLVLFHQAQGWKCPLTHSVSNFCC